MLLEYWRETMEFEAPEERQTVFVTLEDRYLTGINTVDEQHKTLVGLCNNLYNTVMQERQKENWEYTDHVKQALEQCAEYAQTHFNTEERLMKACNYEGLSDHKYKHKQFIKRVSQESQFFDKITYEQTMDFLKFLKEWVLSHISYEDRLFVKPLKKYIIENHMQ